MLINKKSPLILQIRVLLWVACGLFVLGFRFGWGDARMGEWFTWHITYTMTWAVTAWLVYEIAQWLKPKVWRWLAAHRTPLIGLTAICGIIHNSEPHFHKVLADEPTHAAIALSMHLHKLVTMPFMMHLPYDITTWDYYSAPFRGHYFSFLVSLLHDITGFRPANVYIVNGMIGWATLASLYALGQKLTGRRDVAFAVAASLAGAPIFGQVMCSGSYDMTNLLLLTLLSYFLLRITTEETPSRKNLRITLLLSTLLAYARPESILYYGIFVCVITFIIYQKEKLITPQILSCEQICGPILFIPTLCTQLVLVSNPYNLTQGQLAEGIPMLSFDHAIRHWTESLAYFLNVTNMNMTNIFFFVAGTTTLMLLIIHTPKAWKKNSPIYSLKGAIFACLLIFGAITGLFTMVMCSFWGGATNPVMTRFTLPLWLMLSISCLLAVTVAQKTRPMEWLKWSPGVALTYFLTFTISAHASGESMKSMQLGYENHKALDWIDSTDDKRTLFVGASSVQFIARKHSAISMTLLSSHIPDYIRLVKLGIIGRLVLIEFRITDPGDGKSVIHEMSWRKTADQWKTKRLWSHQYTIGVEMVAEELTGVTFNGKFYDLTIKEEGLPPGRTLVEMQQKVVNMLPKPE